MVRDGAFGGNTQAYEAYRDVTSTVAEIGTAICGSYYAAKGGNVCFVAGTLVQTEHGGLPKVLDKGLKGYYRGGATPNTYRYYFNGKYIDLSFDGFEHLIVSYGSQFH